MTTCPFCGRDPYHYVDNGIGMEAVAVNCCELGVDLFSRREKEPESITVYWDDFLKIAGKLADLQAATEALEELAILGEEGMKPNYGEWLTFHDKVANVARSALGQSPRPTEET